MSDETSADKECERIATWLESEAELHRKIRDRNLYFDTPVAGVEHGRYAALADAADSIRAGRHKG